jgi:predicted RNase H-like nuclease
VVARTAARGPASATVQVVPAFADVLALDCSAVAIDIPIGLPDRGSRACDREARVRIGPRRSSVFPAPVRAVVNAASYADALAAARAVDGRGLSRQAWGLMPKIADVDRAMTPTRQSSVVECHPEVCFALLAGAPLDEPKRTAEGRAARIALLTPHIPGAAELAAVPPAGAAADDVLDALAAAWTARRLVAGDVVRLGDGAFDDRGLRMEIVA